jgi:hypothetical protein
MEVLLQKVRDEFLFFKSYLKAPDVALKNLILLTRWMVILLHLHQVRIKVNKMTT